MPPDSNPSARAYQHQRNDWLKTRYIYCQQQHAKRKHPETEYGQDSKKAAKDEEASKWNPELAEASVQKGVDDPAGRWDSTRNCVQLTVQAALLVNHCGLVTTSF